MWIFIFIMFAAASCSSESNSKSKLDALDAQILEVKDEIKKTELGAMKEELDSQGNFRDNYSQFASKIEKGEKEELKAEQLRKQLEALQQEKLKLLKEK